jgi:hypothetical protein
VATSADEESGSVRLANLALTNPGIEYLLRIFLEGIIANLPFFTLSSNLPGDAPACATSGCGDTQAATG